VSAEVPNSGSDRPPKRPVYEQVYEISPRDAVDEYISCKSEEVEPTTIRNYHKHLKFFIEWAEQNGLESMYKIDGYDFKEFAKWRKLVGNEVDGSLSPRTQKDSQKTLSQFVKWCGRTEFTRRGTHEKVRVPNVSSSRPDPTIDYHFVREMVKHADKYHYASIKHVVCLLFAETGARTGGLRALDIGHFEHKGNFGILHFRSDKPNGTRLKNGVDGERKINISLYCADVISDYIEHKRNDTIDEYGREPLLVAGEGRIGESTPRKYIYELSRPCVIDGLCPSGIDIDSCPGREGHAHKCKDNISPKEIRSSYITYLSKEGVHKDKIGYRCNVCPTVLEKHYNQMTLDEKRRNQPGNLQRITRKGVQHD